MCVYEMEGRFHWEISLLAGEGGGALAAQFLVAIEGAFFFLCKFQRSISSERSEREHMRKERYQEDSLLTFHHYRRI